MFTEEMLTEILESASNALTPVFELLDWGEDEISKAIGRHPHAADTLYHSFTLIRPTSDRMHTEFVYRGHSRELLDRVARGEDTRPGTAAEVVIAMCEVALATPITQSASGLVFRMWADAFPDQPRIGLNNEHREALHGSTIDDHEEFTRAKLAVPDRVLGPIECSGRHHGERVDCAYAPQTVPFDLVEPEFVLS
ncbi:hypothetical protein SAMN05421630_11563 [Prauserella marina]|uniref:Uncharacterized protein n=1 Tax=Prauserella marina TaxID=530584 RepID=A0A1G6Z0U1_9PSEU|nr:hypothetical protein [Prauserella marina]PWV71333.1 hypothetical protein DES30_11249 [Prauserella marina]SDD96364.1 hypothetical protein SAMN05421630_11563 [Prauserella marina]